jgi:hypothetical protein
MTNRNKKRDANHAELVADLRKCGYTVFDCGHFGDGFPDLAVMGRDNVITLIEVKTARGKLTAAEKKFFSLFGGAENLLVARRVEDVLDAL